MTFNISEFSAKVNSLGLAKNNLFVARVIPPAQLLREFPNNQRDFIFLAKTAEIPSLDLEYQEVKVQSFGVTSKRPTGMTFQPVSVIFMVDQGFLVKRFFERWMQLIINYDNRSINGTEGGKLPFEIGYKKDYEGDLYVDVYSANNDRSVPYTHAFGRCNPISVGGTTTSWENDAEIMTMTVTFTYENYFTPATVQGQTTPTFGT